MKYRMTKQELALGFVHAVVNGRKWAFGAGFSRKPTLAEKRDEVEYLSIAYERLKVLCKKLKVGVPPAETQWFYWSALPPEVFAVIQSLPAGGSAVTAYVVFCADSKTERMPF